MRHVPPSLTETAFSCPHCSALTTQFWHRLGAERLAEDSPHPYIPTPEKREFFAKNKDLPPDVRQKMLKWHDQMISGLVFLEGEAKWFPNQVFNVYLSKCFNCKKIAVWISDRLVFPSAKEAVAASPDLPDHIVKDFEEAREIVAASPRGAAALLRLCVQKLCAHLGEKGKNIDEDIKSLVLKGLNPRVQQALDIVRVIGNEAVHPGVIDLNDNRDIALHLFKLVNAIVDQMITHPKTVDELYGKLPESKRKAIEARDAKPPAS